MYKSREGIDEQPKAFNDRGLVCECKIPNPHWIGDDDDLVQICFNCRKDLSK